MKEKLANFLGLLHGYAIYVQVRAGLILFQPCMSELSLLGLLLF